MAEVRETEITIDVVPREKRSEMTSCHEHLSRNI